MIFFFQGERGIGICGRSRGLGKFIKGQLEEGPPLGGHQAAVVEFGPVYAICLSLLSVMCQLVVSAFCVSVSSLGLANRTIALTFSLS